MDDTGMTEADKIGLVEDVLAIWGEDIAREIADHYGVNLEVLGQEPTTSSNPSFCLSGLATAAGLDPAPALRPMLSPRSDSHPQSSGGEALASSRRSERTAARANSKGRSATYAVSSNFSRSSRGGEKNTSSVRLCIFPDAVSVRR